MEGHISFLKQHFKTHRRAASFLGVSKDRYYQWVAKPACIPSQGRRLIELAVESIQKNNPEGEQGGDCEAQSTGV